jgi:hypothetical protein
MEVQLAESISPEKETNNKAYIHWETSSINQK